MLRVGAIVLGHHVVCDLGRRFSGRLDLEHLPNDREYFDDDRSAAGFRHYQSLGTAWTADVDLNWVSDDDYLDDFGDRQDPFTE